MESSVRPLRRIRGRGTARTRSLWIAGTRHVCEDMGLRSGIPTHFAIPVIGSVTKEGLRLVNQGVRSRDRWQGEHRRRVPERPIVTSVADARANTVRCSAGGIIWNRGAHRHFPDGIDVPRLDDVVIIGAARTAL